MSSSADLPDERFCQMWTALGAQSDHRATLERLRAAYDEPHRAYHTARHVGACLALLDDPAVRVLAERPVEVEAALWFHDAVYDTRAADNEERSAVLAEESLGAAGTPRAVAARVAAHVRATRDHLATSADAQLVIDIDLSILGADPETFSRFEQEIRREYSWVDDEAYRAGRAAVLRRFQERASIYGTPLLRERYEPRARENIARSLAELTADR